MTTTQNDQTAEEYARELVSSQIPGDPQDESQALDGGSKVKATWNARLKPGTLDEAFAEQVGRAFSDIFNEYTQGLAIQRGFNQA
jgi:acetoin utilization deacetylase AcuC-like enzyme